MLTEEGLIGRGVAALALQQAGGVRPFVRACVRACVCVSHMALSSCVRVRVRACVAASAN